MAFLTLASGAYQYTPGGGRSQIFFPLFCASPCEKATPLSALHGAVLLAFFICLAHIPSASVALVILSFRVVV
jgi:hypothetical protein